MKSVFFALAALVLSVSAHASTPSDQVAAIDKAREGNLQDLVLAKFKAESTVACEPNQVVKYSITKISSGSANQEKKPGTPFDYEANYLLIQRCLTGTTFVGAYLDVQKSVIMTASFTSKYNSSNGPKKMESLKIAVVRDADLSMPAPEPMPEPAPAP